MDAKETVTYAGGTNLRRHDVTTNSKEALLPLNGSGRVKVDMLSYLSPKSSLGACIMEPTKAIWAIHGDPYCLAKLGGRYDTGFEVLASRGSWRKPCFGGGKVHGGSLVPPEVKLREELCSFEPELCSRDNSLIVKEIFGVADEDAEKLRMHPLFEAGDVDSLEKMINDGSNSGEHSPDLSSNAP
ncbi:hypothetical protein RHMOL_Rhmol04G0187000 [Rhododendron molle]|uniref:Uncharacterized protein n=1 Tax=Rhododendron molle TaxID=49168 RepID=A0ACC0P1U5_RHOML|nr:hypothetical protein RHMOL_Rhmol04G0187000 [Rhododendron molle]